MARSRYRQFKEWMSEKAKSKPAQFIASIGTGAGLGYSVYYFLDLGFAAMSGGNTYIALKVFNALLAAATFIVTSAMASDQIEVSINSNAEVEKKLTTVMEKFNSMLDEMREIRSYLSDLRLGGNQVRQWDSVNPREDITPFELPARSAEMSPAMLASIEMKPLSAQAHNTPLGNFNFMSQTHANPTTSLREPLLANDSLNHSIIDIRSPQNISTFKF